MFARVELCVADLAAAERFYATVLGAAGIARDADFALVPATPQRPPTRGLHVGFAAGSRAAVDAFHRAGVAAGHRDDGAPGPRPRYVADYYGAFLLDPEGTSAEAVHRAGVRDDGGAVDHLWIRVADLDAAVRWYEALAPRAGLRAGTRLPERAHFAAGDRGGSFGLVQADAEHPPTRHAHLAIALADPAARAGELRDPDGNRVELLAPSAPPASV